MHKISWADCGRVHATVDHETTVCGLRFRTAAFVDLHPLVQVRPDRKMAHCPACFKTPQDYRALWLGERDPPS